MASSLDRRYRRLFRLGHHETNAGWFGRTGSGERADDRSEPESLVNRDRQFPGAPHPKQDVPISGGLVGGALSRDISFRNDRSAGDDGHQDQDEQQDHGEDGGEKLEQKQAKRQDGVN